MHDGGLRFGQRRPGLSLAAVDAIGQAHQGRPGDGAVLGLLHNADAAAAAETAVIYMGALHAERIVEGLAARGVARTTPIALVESASATSENKLRGVLRDLPALAATLGDGPSILIVGAIAAGNAGVSFTSCLLRTSNTNWIGCSAASSP